MKNNRKTISQETLKTSICQISDKTDFRLKQKGYHAWQSTHEILGIITEEYWELQEAIKNNDKDAIKKELIDIGVACHFGVACIDENTLDW